MRAALQVRRPCSWRALLSAHLFGREQRRLVLRHERINDLLQRFAVEDLWQLVERQIDPMIGHPALREIVGADALGAVAAADLPAARSGAFGIPPLRSAS